MSLLRQRIASAMVLTLAAASLLTGLPACAPAAKVPVYTSFPDLSQAGLRKVWERQIALAPNETINNAWRIGDSVYLTTDQARIIRIEAASGVKAFDTLVGSEASDFHRPLEISGGKQVLIADRGHFFILAKDTGRVLVSQRVESLITSAPVIIGNTLCVGGNDYFQGLYLDQLGGRRWVTPAPKDGFVSTPAVISGSLLIASRNGKLWRINAEDGNWLWKDRQANGQVTAPLAADQHTVYVPSLDQYLYAFDVNNGSELWDQRLDGQLDQQPILTKQAGGEVLIPATGKGLYALDPIHGFIRWQADGVTQVASVNGDFIWAGDSSGNLRSIRIDTGEIVSSTPIDGAQSFIRSPDEWVIILNKSGVLDGFVPNR